MHLYLGSKVNTKPLCVEQPTVSTVKDAELDKSGEGGDRHGEQNWSGKWPPSGLNLCSKSGYLGEKNTVSHRSKEQAFLCSKLHKRGGVEGRLTHCASHWCLLSAHRLFWSQRCSGIILAIKPPMVLYHQ